MRRFPVLSAVVAAVLLAGGHAEGQDEEYLRVYSLIQEGDGLSTSGQLQDALAKYHEAQTALQSFRKVYPDWNPKVVDYRLEYLATKIADVTTRTPAGRQPEAVRSNTPVAPAPVRGPDTQLTELQQQVRRLQSDNELLEAKLKEALAAQPAAADPHELAKAQDTIRSLQKENELLRVVLAKTPAKSAPVPDASQSDQLKRELADTTSRLAEQTDKADALAQDKKALQSKLDDLIAASWNSTNIAATKKALDESNRELAAQTALASKLAREKDDLQARVRDLSADAGAASALRAENEILKKQLAQVQAAKPPNADDLTHRLAEAQVQIAVLQSEKENLMRERNELKDRGGPPASPTAAAPSGGATAASSSATRVRQLERERDDLQKKLEAAQKELSAKNRKTAGAKVDELAGQLEVVRTRLGVFEAQRVPYTPEELALLRQPEIPPADPKAGKKSVTELPAGAVTLVADARRDFAAGRYGKAEEKYLEALRQDEKNVYTLANLAAIQLELDHLADAESHINRALAIAPDDAFSLMILGQIRYRQQKYDESLDALGRAAKLDPQNAAIQNSLGLVLSQKGMRSAAETAFRKAILIEPGYASAHNNLAVFYAMQKPPSIPLARWHYQKALAAGLARNPDLEKMLEQSGTGENSR